jgi:hypothetical protein
MGVASSSRAFFQQIGGSLGVSLFGVIFFKRFASTMATLLPGAHVAAGASSLDPAAINSLPGPVKDAAFHAISHGIDGVFWWSVPVTIGVFLLALCVKEIPLRTKIEPTEPTEPAGEPTPSSPEFAH